MNKISGQQVFSRYNEKLNHVYKSDLKIINGSKVFCDENHKTPLHSNTLVVCKYTKLGYLAESIAKGTFYFSSPANWIDPFEKLFYKNKYKIGDENVTLHACCFANNDIENEEGFWNIWSKGETDRIVRVTYNIEKLLEALDKQAVDKYLFYLGRVQYISRKEIIEKISNNTSCQSLEEYLNILCKKRNAYEYEHELRLFVKISDAGERNLEQTIINNIDYSSGVIMEITLPPEEPKATSNEEEIREIQERMNREAKNKLQQLIDVGKLACEINQSALYCVSEVNRTY